MANRPKKIKRSWKPKREAFARPIDFTWFYNQSRWRKVAKLRKEKNPLCRICKENGLISPNEVTDHIRGLKFLLDNGFDPYDDNELDDLCHKCHNKKSGRESHAKRGMGSNHKK